MVHKSLAVAKPRRMIWAGTIQPADDPGPSTSDEVALVSSVFDFADANHVELHGNILIAEGLMRQLCPYDTKKHATLAQRATSLRRECVPYHYADTASGGTVTRGVYLNKAQLSRKPLVGPAPFLALGRAGLGPPMGASGRWARPGAWPATPPNAEARHRG